MSNTQLGEKIKSLRTAKKVSLKTMGELFGIGLTTYASKENRGDFDEPQLNAILKKLGVNRKEFEAYETPGATPFELSLPEAIISIDAKLDVTLSALAEILAKQNGQTVTGATNELTKAVKERYERKTAELLRSGQ